MTIFGNNKPSRGTTLITENCEIEGDVRFTDELIVNSYVKGCVLAEPGTKAIVRVTERGRVRGDIRVPNVVINGKVIGDIHADRHVELSAKASIKGNVFYHLIEMVMGSRVDGSLVHVKDGNIGDVKAELQAMENADRNVGGTDKSVNKGDDKGSEKPRESIATVSGNSKGSGKSDRLRRVRGLAHGAFRVWES